MGRLMGSWKAHLHLAISTALSVSVCMSLSTSSVARGSVMPCTVPAAERETV